MRSNPSLPVNGGAAFFALRDRLLSGRPDLCWLLDVGTRRQVSEG